jgi:hypothetical protein
MASRYCGSRHPPSIQTSRVDDIADETRRGENNGKDCVSLALAGPAFGPRKLCANPGRAAGQDDDSVFVLIWNPADQVRTGPGAMRGRLSFPRHTLIVATTAPRGIIFAIVV